MALELRLDRLELRNFHQFANYSVDFDEHMTVLVGNNGSGKSSILAAACVAMGAFFFPFAGLTQRSIDQSDARLELFENETVGQYPVTVFASGWVMKDGNGGQIDWSRSLNSADGKTTYGEASDLINLARECKERIQNGDSGLVLPLISHYGTGRLWAKSSFSSSSRRASFSRLDGYKGALDARADDEQMLRWFYKMTAQDVQRAQSFRPMEESPLYAAVRSAVEECFRAITGSADVRVAYDFGTDDLVVEYIDQRGDVQRMPMSLLSDGYRSTLSMFADIAYRMAILNPSLGGNVLETPGVVMIDEVDLHLHPRWQGRILGDLRRIFPNVQFIVTTHAPSVISSVEARNIRLLSGGDSARHLGGEIAGSDVARVLMTVMDAPARPEWAQRLLDRFYVLLDKGDFDEAKSLLREMERRIGEDDGALTEAKTALMLEEADARYATDKEG